jgi:AbrB family looped-hinge helix DNA binding protein
MLGATPQLTVLPILGITSSMNMHNRIFRSSLTSKCQATIPKVVREALGLEPGGEVAFELDESGNVRILKVDEGAEIERRKAQFRQRLEEVRKKFRPLPEFAGMDGLEYQRWIRGDGPEV